MLATLHPATPYHERIGYARDLERLAAAELREPGTLHACACGARTGTCVAHIPACADCLRSAAKRVRQAAEPVRVRPALELTPRPDVELPAPPAAAPATATQLRLPFDLGPLFEGRRRHAGA